MFPASLPILQDSFVNSHRIFLILEQEHEGQHTTVPWARPLAISGRPHVSPQGLCQPCQLCRPPEGESCCLEEALGQTAPYEVSG